jgi:hypothetical protein
MLTVTQIAAFIGVGMAAAAYLPQIWHATRYASAFCGGHAPGGLGSGPEAERDVVGSFATLAVSGSLVAAGRR